MCEAEMCVYWTGDGCACALLDIAPRVACEHGSIRDECLACEEAPDAD